MQAVTPHFLVSIDNPHHHEFSVKLTVSNSSLQHSVITLPSWIPGSYMIRDFAKNIIQLTVTDLNGTPLKFSKQDKQTWLINNNQAGYIVEYLIYAFDISVRTAYLDQLRGFFNGTSLFLRVDEFQAQPQRVEVKHPKACPEWRLATGLPRLTGDTFDFGTFEAPDYLTLIDHPFEMANFDVVSFDVYGIPHYVVVSGKQQADLQRIAADLKPICQHHLDYFEAPYPVTEYYFFVNVVGNGFGGLEHLNSTALLCSRNTLPTAHLEAEKITDDYQVFLSLCSHEYFHTWNVKRIKPAEFVTPDISSETYSRQLWFYEGITSYIDDWSINQCELIDANQYLSVFSKTLTRLNNTQGRFVQSVADSSFDAWTKFYKQDENARNAIVSYYVKGAVIALGLDLMIRQRSNNAHNLNTVMKAFWQEWAAGNTSQPATYAGTFDRSFIEKCKQATQVDVSDIWSTWIEGTGDIPLANLLMPFGVALTEEAVKDKNIELGLNLKPTNAGLSIVNVQNGLAAAQSGLAANDLIIAINQLKVDTQVQFDSAVLNQAPNTPLRIHAFRRDELMEFTLTVPETVQSKITLAITDKSKAERWLKKVN